MKGGEKLNITPKEVVDKYSATVYRLAFAYCKSKADSDDVFQEVFLRYFKTDRDFESEQHRKAWLIRVTINCSKEQLKSFKNTKATDLSEQIVFDSPNELSLVESLGKLNAKQRVAIHLFYYEDMSIKDVAKSLSVSESHARTILTRARAKLRELLKGEDYEF